MTNTPMFRRRWLTGLALAGLAGFALPRTAGSQSAATVGTGDWARVTPGSIVLFRHATAPGVGDPPGFRLDDCSTQRNLDETGRAQARRIGEAFRSRRIAVAQVISSQWCRARETADLAFPGQRRDDPSFNSFFEDRARSDPQTAAARQVLAAFKGPGVLVVVTHQVNITGLTGEVAASGEGVVVRLGATPGRALEVLGRVQP